MKEVGRTAAILKFSQYIRTIIFDFQMSYMIS